MQLRAFGLNKERSKKNRLFYALRQKIDLVLRELARQKDREIIKGYLIEDHVHVLISIYNKYSVSSVIRYIKDKLTNIHISKFSWIEEKFCMRIFLVTMILCLNSV